MSMQGYPGYPPHAQPAAGQFAQPLPLDRECWSSSVAVHQRVSYSRKRAAKSPMFFSFTRISIVNMLLSFLFTIISYLDLFQGKLGVVQYLKLAVQLMCVYTIMFGK